MSRKFSTVEIVSLGIAALVLWFGFGSDEPEKTLPPELAVEQTTPAPDESQKRASLAVTNRFSVLQYSVESEAPSHLTADGVVQWTNKERAAKNLPELVANELLSRAAQSKVDDMFDRGYFAHISPLEVSPSDLVKEVGYDHLLAGENLALGNFRDDETLIKAWMKSAPHKKNILREHYTEIGVAVGRGMFEGRETWLAVQTFATPTDVCSLPDEELLDEAESTKQEIHELSEAIQEVRDAMRLTPGITQEEHEVLIQEFKQLTQRRNDLIPQSRGAMREYDSQITEYNRCNQKFLGTRFE